MKFCKKCDTVKPVEAFWKLKSNKDGLQACCIICFKKTAKAWRESNKDKWNNYSKKYYSENKDHVLKKNADWYAANPSAVKAKDQKRQRNHPDKIREKTAKRRATKLQATPIWADNDKLNDIYYSADQLGMLTGEWYHVDHIVPLHSKIVCGLHCPDNLQIITAKENLSKSNRHWPDMP